MQAMFVPDLVCDRYRRANLADHLHLRYELEERRGTAENSKEQLRSATWQDHQRTAAAQADLPANQLLRPFRSRRLHVGGAEEDRLLARRPTDPPEMVTHRKHACDPLQATDY